MPDFDVATLQDLLARLSVSAWHRVDTSDGTSKHDAAMADTMLRECAAAIRALMAERNAAVGVEREACARRAMSAAPHLSSIDDWHVSKCANGTANEIHIVLSSDEEARAWAVWLFENARDAEAANLGANAMPDRPDKTVTIPGDDREIVASSLRTQASIYECRAKTLAYQQGDTPAINVIADRLRALAEEIDGDE